MGRSPEHFLYLCFTIRSSKPTPMPDMDRIQISSRKSSRIHQSIRSLYHPCCWLTHKIRQWKMQNKNSKITCIFPMSNENKTNPKIEINTAKNISPVKVLVLRFCPRELKNEKQLIQIQVRTNIRVEHNAIQLHKPKTSQTPPKAVWQFIYESFSFCHLRLKNINEYSKVKSCRIHNIIWFCKRASFI